MTSRRSDSGLDGILLVDKPAGWTSHDVVAKVRRLTGQRRIGHTGTLDPLATGLLVLCLGRATKLVEYLTGHDKRYTGTVQLGRTTATDDSEGEVVRQAEVPALDAVTLEGIAARFRGPLLQVPPGFSALKVGGKRAYTLARAGQPPELAPRAVTIRGLAATLSAHDTLDIDVTCSAGTYVRSLARDLGAALGCGGHLSQLRRESAGPFDVADSVTLEALEHLAVGGRLESRLLEPDEGLLELEAALVGVEAASAIANGVAWRTDERPLEMLAPIRIYGAAGAFVGVGSLSSLGELRASKVIMRDKSANF